MEPRTRCALRRTAAVVSLAVVAITVVLASIANSQTVRSPDFVLVQAWSQLANPTGVRFAANGRVFIMGKGGVIYTADSVQDQTVKVAADISTQVFNNFDKGLVGLAPHPTFPANRHVYLLYARDGEIGGAVPIFNDLCPSGICFTSGALARMTWDPDQEILTNLEEIVVDWCSGSTTHAMGDLRFDAQGNLIFSAGDNTFFSNALNFGENPPNRCPFGDPADPESGGVMQCQSPPATSGKLLYIPISELNAWQRGQPAPQLRELARGFRNPYRFAVDPVTNGLYLGDVGFGEWEEINFIPPVGSGPVRNYGWPCFEGTLVQPSVQSRQFARCEALYRNPETHSRAAFQYSHSDTQVGNAVTRAGGASAVTAIGFSSRDGFPVSYRNSLFWADYTRGGFWAVRRNATGLDWDNMQMAVEGMSQIVDITEGPDGALYVSQVWAGIVWRFNAASRELPVVRITPSVRSGLLPLTVQFSSAGTLDTTGGSLTYAWDLDGSGQFTGPATPGATLTYTQAGPVTVSLRVRSSSTGNPTNSASVTIFPGSSLSGSLSFNVSDWAFAIGDNIRFSADIRTETNAIVPASNFQWQVLISHCYPGPECTNTANCHQHLVNSYSGVATETLTAPDHEYPSDLEFVLRVQHPTYPELVQTFTRRLQPNFVNAQVTTNPPGLDVILNIFRYTSPVTLPNLQNGELSLDALSPQMINRQGYRFTGWSQGGSATQVIRPVNGTVYTANYEPFTIGNHAAGQGPAAPTGLAAAPAFRQCTLTWSSVTDQTNPVTGYIVYHREVKAGETLPAFSSALVPATTNSFEMSVDTGSRCEFSMSASTAVGESSFRSATVGAQSNHLPPVGAEWCPDTRCRYRTVLVDNFSAGTSPRNMLGLLQEGEFLRQFGVVDGKLAVSAQGAGTYFYSLMGTAAQCFDSTQFTHLTFKITAQPGWTLRVGMDSRDATCTSFLAKREVNAASWTPEGAFTGQEQTVTIPVAEISNNPQGVQSIFFNTFTPEQVYLFDDIYFVNNCTGTPPGPGGCTNLPVERFGNLDVNQLGYFSGVEGVTRTVANGVMTLRATAADGYWATLVSGTAACRNLTQYGSIRFNIQPVSGTAYPNIQLQQRLADCSARDPEGTITVPLAPYVANGVATVPLSVFAAANLARGHGIVLNGWPVGVDFTVSNLDLVCASPPTTTTTTATTSTTTATTTTVPGSCPSPIVMDNFATFGENTFGLWSGGEGATITYAGGQMTLRATAADAYFASLVSAVACRDLTAHTALRFGLTVPAGAALPTLQIQARNAACTGRDAAVNALVPLTPAMIANGVATVPISAFSAVVPANRIHALALSGFALNQDYVFSSMQWVCTASATTTTSVTTSTTTTTTTVPGTCPSPLVADTFAVAEQNAFGLWASGEGAAFTYANNALTLRATAAGAYYASVISGTGCRDLTAFSVLQFGLTVPAGAALPILQVQARAASCTGPRDPAINAMIPLSPDMIVNGVVSIPFSAFTATVPANRIHALALTGWTVGQDYVLSNMQFVCLASMTTPTTAPTSTSTTATTTATPTVTPVPCTPLTIDTFAVFGRNDIGSWGGGEGVLVTYANNRASVTATSADAYFAENLSGPTECRDLSSYSALQFGITPASGTAFPTTIALQLKNAACNARDPMASVGVPFGRYVVGNVATVPLSAFAGANLSLGHAIVLNGWPLNIEYGLTNMRLICATAPPASTPTSTATVAPTVAPTTTATVPPPPPPAPTCARLVIDTFTLGTTANNLGQTTSRSPTSAITRTAGNTLTIVSSATNGATWTSVVSTATSCRDVSGFSHLQFQIRGPVGGSLAVRLQYVDATVANCQTRGTAPLRTASLRVTPTGMTSMTAVTVRVPLANLVGLVRTKVHAYGLTGFTVGTFVVSNVQFVSSACPAV